MAETRDDQAVELVAEVLWRFDTGQGTHRWADAEHDDRVDFQEMARRSLEALRSSGLLSSGGVQPRPELEEKVAEVISIAVEHGLPYRDRMRAARAALSVIAQERVWVCPVCDEAMGARDGSVDAHCAGSLKEGTAHERTPMNLRERGGGVQLDEEGRQIPPMAVDAARYAGPMLGYSDMECRLRAFLAAVPRAIPEGPLVEKVAAELRTIAEACREDRPAIGFVEIADWAERRARDLRSSGAVSGGDDRV